MYHWMRAPAKPAAARAAASFAFAVPPVLWSELDNGGRRCGAQQINRSVFRIGKINHRRLCQKKIARAS